MLSIGAMSGGQAGYYLSLSREDYYLEGGEPLGVWLGSAAQILGLPETVEPDHLYNLFDGLTPEGDRPLVQLQKHDGKHEHRPGWDLTFSAPKSVSALWSQCDAHERQIIQRAHFDSVKEAISYLEETAVLARRGVGGKRMEPAKALVATFEHGTSRAQDPQLHTHALLLNIGVREDGTTGTLSSLAVFQAKMAAGALYRANLAHRLGTDLGVEVEREGSAFRIVGVSPVLCEWFSKRRKEIEAELSRQGVSGASGAAKVTLQTRDSKEEVSRSELLGEWQAQGARLGFGAVQARRLLDARVAPVRSEEMTLTEAATRLLSEGAHFNENDLVRRLSESAQGRGVSAKDVRRISSELMEGCFDVVRLGPKRRGVHFTYRSVLEDENRFFSICDDLNKKATHLVDAVSVENAIAEINRGNRGQELLKEQADAVRWLTRLTGDVALMDGIAGSGKTRTLEAAARAWESCGFKVQGLALSGRAARELSQKAGIECTTIAKSLYELEKAPVAIQWSTEQKRLYVDVSGCRYQVDSKTVLIVDEAGMVNTSDFLRLAKECQKKGAKIVAVGDPRQLQAIEGASPFGEMIERYRSATLDEILRQRAKWQRDAVRDLAAGRADEALKRFAERGFVSVTKTQEEARQALFAQWLKSQESVKDKLILTDRVVDAKLLNQMAQQARKKELGIAWVTVGDTKLFMGDRVSFTKTSQARQVNNGDRGTLVGINPLPGYRAATVKLDNGERVTVDLDKFPHLDLGYASTTHRAQGETVREAYVLTGSPMQDKHLAYVQGSRAKELTHFFLTEGEAGDELSDIAKRMSRDRLRTTARQELSKEAPRNPEQEVFPAQAPKRNRDRGISH